MRFVSEFKDFALKGNVVDLAVGVIIGTAFGKIVASAVSDVIMPVVGILLGGVNFTNLKYTISDATADHPAATLNYGTFIQTTVDFTIIAFVLFSVIKAMNSMKKKQEAAPAAPAPATEVLLTEIRDLLKK